jgi:hypothetical protein
MQTPMDKKCLQQQSLYAYKLILTFSMTRCIKHKANAAVLNPILQNVPLLAVENSTWR